MTTTFCVVHASRHILSRLITTMKAHQYNPEPALMKTYSAFMQRSIATAGPQATFTITVQAVSSAMAKVTAEAQYPGYKCFNAPTQVR